MKELIALKNCRIVATLLLAICFVLPLSRCSSGGLGAERPASVASQVSASSAKEVPVASDHDNGDIIAYQSILEAKKVEDVPHAVSVLVVFFSPLLVFLVSPKRRAIATIFLAAFSFYMLGQLTIGTIRYGGVLAIVAWLALLAVSVFELEYVNRIPAGDHLDGSGRVK